MNFRSSSASPLIMALQPPKSLKGMWARADLHCYAKVSIYQRRTGVDLRRKFAPLEEKLLFYHRGDEFLFISKPGHCIKIEHRLDDRYGSLSG
jgi:hypothetical protein